MSRWDRAARRRRHPVVSALAGVLALLALLLATGVTPAHALVAGRVPGALQVGIPVGEPLWLRPHARTLREADGVVDPTLGPALLHADLPWQPVPDLEPVFAFGFDRSAYWVHVALRHDGAEPLRLVLEAAEPLIDDLRLWVVDRASGALVAHAQLGDRIADLQRPIDYRHPALPFVLLPGRTVDVLVRVHAVDGEHDPLPLRLWHAPDFAGHALWDNWVYGAYYGAIVALLLYNLLVFAGTRERSFGLYALFLASFLLWNLTFRGYALQYLWPGAVTWNQIALVGGSALIYASMAAFSWSLLDVPQRTPWLFRLQAALALAALAHGVWIVADPTAATFATLDLVGLTMFIALLLAAARIAWRGERVAWIYFGAHGALFAGAGVYYATKLELVTPGPLSLHALNLGSAAEFVLLGFALAYRINRLKAERDEAQARLVQTLQEAAQRLEREVARRTEELREVNRRLEEMATRDALTGLLNRHQLHERLLEELARAQRSGQPLAVLMLDLDHFKTLNDRGGHPYGDHVLRQLGALLGPPLLRGTDRAFRVGGEEFLVLAPATDAAGLQRLAERIRTAVQTQAWPHPDAAIGWVSVSVGGTLSRPDDTPESIFERVDRALYDAKQRGRNRCAYA